MAELREPHAEDRSKKQSDDEDAEVANFNQNTDYDEVTAQLHHEEGAKEATRDEGSVEDPFSVRNLAIQQFIYTARVYDALLTLITLQNDGVAKDLMELHAAGHILGPSPVFTGTFLTDEMNASDEASTNNQDDEAPSTD